MSAARCVAPSAFARFRFPPEVITLAVRWYLRFGLSYRDVEELLVERGVEVDPSSLAHAPRCNLVNAGSGSNTQDRHTAVARERSGLLRYFGALARW